MKDMPYTIYAGLSDRNRREFRQSGIKATPEQIIKAVGAALNLNSKDIKGPCRRRELVEARYIAIALILNTATISLKAVGALFNNRDHSTIIYARETYNDLMETNKEFQKKADMVKLRNTI